MRVVHNVGQRVACKGYSSRGRQQKYISCIVGLCTLGLLSYTDALNSAIALIWPAASGSCSAEKRLCTTFTQPTTSVQSYKIPRLRLITLSFLIVVCINLQLYGHDKFLFVKVMNVNEVTLYILFCCSVASKWTTGQRRNTTVQLLALQSSTPTASAATHFVTDRRTDKHTDDIIMPTADHTPV